MTSLFNEESLSKYVSSLQHLAPNEEDIVNIVKPWFEMVQQDNIAFTESNLEQSFLADFFEKILGYTTLPNENFSLIPKMLAKSKRGFPDFILGKFRQSKGKITVDERIVVGELKGTNKKVEEFDKSRGKSPVDQAFEYAVTNGVDVLWVVVSNIKTIRLYSSTDKDSFTEFKLKKFLKENFLTNHFWNFYFLLHQEFLIAEKSNNPLLAMLKTKLSDRIRLSEDFYLFYRNAVWDIFEFLILKYKDLSTTSEGRRTLLEKSRKLIDRGLMICFLSDHPLRLLPHELLKKAIENAESYPIVSNTKIYPVIKQIFEFIDNRATPPSGYEFKIFPYDGGLFADDEILDDSNLLLNDSLFHKKYKIGNIEIIGIYGFHVFDFYLEINSHLLGRIFEYGVRDQEVIITKLNEDLENLHKFIDGRKQFGMVYTRENLASFASKSVLIDMFEEIKKNILLELKGEIIQIKKLDNKEKLRFWKKYEKKLLEIRILDLSVGSGAFLVECYLHLSNELRNAHNQLKILQPGVLGYFNADSQVLKKCLFGKDIMSEAISTTKLSLWLASAKKDVPFHAFENNFSIGDSLTNFFSPNQEDESPPKFDLVIGNPPWGAVIDSNAIEFFKSNFTNITNIENLDSFELFVYLGLNHLKENGRLAYILPHTSLLPEKEEIRKYILNNTTIERWHYLGSDWFGSDIRMNTTFIQTKNSKPEENSEFKSFIIVGEDRRKAISGEMNLRQIESTYSHKIPQKRCITKNNEVELFRYINDDPIMAKMEDVSVGLAEICNRGRGVELGKVGEIIQCPSCLAWDSPPRKKRNTPTEELEKSCSHCSYSYKYNEALGHDLIVLNNEDDQKNCVPYIDGDSFNGRYKPLSYKWIVLGYDGINYKDQEMYKSPKIFIRQAGVGLSIAIDEINAYCPQSVYIYKTNSTPMEELNNRSWSDIVNPKFIAAVLQSRMFAYFVFKRFGEIDASQAFSKLTHKRMELLPIPVKEHESDIWKNQHDKLVELYDELVKSDGQNVKIDKKIENIVAELYCLSINEKGYIFGQFGLVAYHKAMQEMFPFGVPPKPKMIPEIVLKAIE